MRKSSELPNELCAQLGEAETFASAVKRLWRENKLAAASAIVILLFILAAILAPVLTPYTFDSMDLHNRLAPPSRAHLLGTDEAGRDVLTRMLYGSRVSLLVGIVPTVISMLAGAILGIIAGYNGGRTDAVIMRIADVMLAFPSMFLAMAIMYTLGDGMINIFLALALVNWASVARIVRAETLKLKETEFVEAARSIGVGKLVIMLRHIFPNCAPSLIVLFTLNIPSAMLRQGGVSYRVVSFSGGQAKNAIPAFGTATIVLSATEEDRAKAIIETFRAEFAEAFGNIESDMVFTTTFGDTAPDRVLTGEVGYGMVGLMTTVPNNVHTMSPFIDGLVESSANLGVVSVDEDMVRFTVFARSSVAYQATQIGVICSALANSFGFTFDSEGHVPGWAVNPISKLTHIACEAYKHLTGTDMIVEPVHAGVECGAFAEKNPHLDMISVGPTLLDVHTPNETCKIEDVKITTELLIEILERIAK